MEKSEKSIPVLPELKDADLYKIKLRCRADVERIALLDKEETVCLNKIVRGGKNNYKQVMWELTGTFYPQLTSQKYKAAVSALSPMRTAYMYRDISVPVKVVYKEPMINYQIIDARRMDKDKLFSLQVSMLAAEARRIFDPEKDTPMRLYVFWTEEEKVNAVLSYFPHTGLVSDIYDFTGEIFSGMRRGQNAFTRIDSGKLDRINTEMRKKCLTYWKDFLPVGEPLAVPGEQEGLFSQNVWDLKTVALENGLEERVRTFCKRKEISFEALVLSAWGELLGGFHNEPEPVLGMLENGEKMSLFPIRIKREKEKQARFMDVDSQIENAVSNSAISQSEFDDLLGQPAQEFFHVIHHFIHMEEAENFF